MGSANRFLAAWVAALGITACHQHPAPAPAPTSGDGTAEGQLASVGAALKSARYALEPPRTRVQTRDAATVPTLDASAVTPEWLMLQVAAMQQVAADTTVAREQRAAANVLAAAGEGLLIEHFTTLFWNKAEPGRIVLGYLREALTLDPHNLAAAVAYTFSIFGIRNSGFRSQAEETMGVRTSPELARIAGMLAEHGSSLLAQTLVHEILTTLADDGPVPSETAELAAGLEQRIATLRTADTDQAEDVDDQLRRYVK